MLSINEELWKEFTERGVARLGRIDSDELRKLQDRINAIMMGEADIDYDRTLMQLDSDTGEYDAAGAQTKGYKGKTLHYRKIQDLEYDPLFLDFVQKPVFREICARVHGSDTRISVFRAMFMNKPAHKGTFLPWHQDRWTMLDRDPIVTIWLALDPATKKNGCVQIIPGSHRFGLINPTHPSGFLSKAQAAAICASDRVEHLELEAGEVVLMHNQVLHGSDVNRSNQSRRALSVCYMDAATLEKDQPSSYLVVFGEGAMSGEALAARASSA